MTYLAYYIAGATAGNRRRRSTTRDVAERCASLPPFGADMSNGWPPELHDLPEIPMEFQLLPCRRPLGGGSRHRRRLCLLGGMGSLWLPFRRRASRRPPGLRQALRGFPSMPEPLGTDEACAERGMLPDCSPGQKRSLSSPASFPLRRGAAVPMFFTRMLFSV